MQSSSGSGTAESEWTVAIADSEEVVAEIVVSEPCNEPLMVAMQPVQEAAEVVVMTETEANVDQDKQEIQEFGEEKNVVSVEPEINVEDDGEGYQWYVKGRRKDDDVDLSPPKKKKRGRPSTASRMIKHEEEDDDDDMYVPLTPAPRKPPNRNPHRLLWSDIDMVKAIKAVREGKISKRGAARKYNVPYSTLKDRISGRVQHGTKPGVRKVMSDKEEKELAHYVKDMQNSGFTINSTMIRERAAEILRLNHGPNTQYWRTVPGVNWFTGFLKRHSDRKNHKPIEITRHFSRQVTYSLKAKRQLLNMFYDMLERQMRSYKVLSKPEKIFSVEVVKSSIYNSDTVLLCASASGNVLPPFVTLTGSSEDEELKEGTTAYPDAYFTCRRSRNVTPELFSTWFTDHFCKHVPETRKCILLVSGQSKFFTVSLMRNMKSANMTLLNIPAQMASILHPIDQSLIDIVGSTLLEKRNVWEEENPERTMDLASYAHMLKKTWKRIPANNIKSSFQKSGIFPFSRTAVVDSYLLVAGERPQVNDLGFQEGEDEFSINDELKLEPEEEDLINDGPQVQVQLYDEDTSQRPTLDDLTEAVAYRTMQEERQNATKALKNIKEDSVCVTNGGDAGMAIETVMPPSSGSGMQFSSVSSRHTRLDSVQSQPPEVFLNPSPDKRPKDGPITTVDVDQQEVVQQEEEVQNEEVVQHQVIVQAQDVVQAQGLVQQQEVVQPQDVVQQETNTIIQPEFIPHTLQQDVVHQEVVTEEVVQDVMLQEEVLSQHHYPQSLGEVIVDNNQIFNEKDIIYATSDELENLQMLQGDNIVYIINEDDQDIGDNVIVDNGDLNNVIVTSNEQFVVTQPTSTAVLPSPVVQMVSYSPSLQNNAQSQSNVRIVQSLPQVQSHLQVQSNAKVQGHTPNVKISPGVQVKTDIVSGNKVVHIVSPQATPTPQVQPSPRVVISPGGTVSTIQPISPKMVSVVKKSVPKQQSVLLNPSEPTKVLDVSGVSLKKFPSGIRNSQGGNSLSGNPQRGNPQGFSSGDSHKVTIKHSQIVTASENSGDIITKLTTPRSPNQKLSSQGPVTVRIQSNDQSLITAAPTNKSLNPRSPKAGQAPTLVISPVSKSPTVTKIPQSPKTLTLKTQIPQSPTPKSPVVQKTISLNLKTAYPPAIENSKNTTLYTTIAGKKQVVGTVIDGVFAASNKKATDGVFVPSATTEEQTMTLPNEVKSKANNVQLPKGSTPKKDLSLKGDVSPKLAVQTNPSQESKTPSAELPRTRSLRRTSEQSATKVSPSKVTAPKTPTPKVATPTKTTRNVTARSSPRHKPTDNKTDIATEHSAPNGSSKAPLVSAPSSSPYGTRSKRPKLQ